MHPSLCCAPHVPSLAKVLGWTGIGNPPIIDLERKYGLGLYVLGRNSKGGWRTEHQGRLLKEKDSHDGSPFIHNKRVCNIS